MSKVKEHWDNVKLKLGNAELMSRDLTIEALKSGEYYKTLSGKARNRTLLKNNIRLYKSIFEYTKDLEEVFKGQNSYKGSYNFYKRVLFLVELDGDAAKLKCACGKRYTWETYCRYCPDYKYNQLGKPHSEETKRKQRVAAITYLKSTVGQVMPRYNKGSIQLIEEYGKSCGYKFMHAENGGEYFIKELGYFLDAYDPIANVALEVDEWRHFDRDGNLVAKDVERQAQIESLLGCKFIRLKYDRVCKK